MESNTLHHLESFLEDTPFPIDKDGLLAEAFDSPLPHSVRDAIALLPDKEYTSRKELREDLLGMSDEEIKKHHEADDEEEEELEEFSEEIEKEQEESEIP